MSLDKTIRLLRAIRLYDFVQCGNMFPTAGRAGRYAGISRATAYKYCRIFEEKGFIVSYELEERGGMSKAYKLTPMGHELLESQKEMF
jgi:DNA-binding MarR family transcriptional regulator